MKENRKLLQEILNEIRQDMTDEEVLNLVLSCVAAIQAPLIMMSQNRQEEKDRNRAENDYKVNLKTEIMIEDLYDKVNSILAKQSQIEKLLAEEKTKGEETKE